MEPTLTNSRLANVGAELIFIGFKRYHDLFQTITRRATLRYENQDWPGMQADATQRLGIYRQVINEVVADIRALMGRRVENDMIWSGMKAVYSRLVMKLDNWEIAETFFNSVTRRIFATVGVDQEIEFVDTDFETPPEPATTTVYHTFPHHAHLPTLIKSILTHYSWQVPYAHLDADATAVAAAIDRQLAAAKLPPHFDQIQIVKSVFYRGMGAYLVGRIVSNSHTTPLVLAILHQENGLKVDAVLLDENSVSILFSFAHSYFHVDAKRPYDLVAFIHSLVPNKRKAEIYISLGYNKHGKTELYRDILRHLQTTDKQFEIAAGQPGMVMTVFNMPDQNLVFKLIKDHFGYPKDNTRKGVMAKYDLVFRHDRAGRLVDAQAFEHLQFARAHFLPGLLHRLEEIATATVCIDEDKVVIHHAYVTRRVIPLDVYLQEATAVEAKAAVLDYGAAIKDMACCNIFPGDMLLKNFGVTRHGRVVFYDYDELCLLEECNFRRIPPGTYEDELAAEPWFHVAENDIFPEEFIHFLGLPDDLKDVFLAEHGDLCHPAYWRETQASLAAGHITHIYPYRPDQRI